MPQSPIDRVDLAACRAMLRGGSRSFFAASLLLPRRVREPAAALYAFCRIADDLIDGGPDPAGALLDLNDRLDAAYAGQPRAHAVDRALSATVLHHAIPRTLLDALLEGFAWDAAGRQYQDFDALEDYAARVAGAVGAMMALLMDARSAQGVARACDLGMAMQLSNIARDVGEDARAGRLYLPQDWMRAEGIDPAAWLAQPRFDPALARVVARLLRAADALYARADAGIAALPRACRPGIGAARRLYAAIGHQVGRDGFDSVGRRAVVPPGRKLQLMARSLAAAARTAPPATPLPPRTAARYLVDAVAAVPPAPARRVVRGFDERAAWLYGLLDALDDRQMNRSRS